MSTRSLLRYTAALTLFAPALVLASGTPAATAVAETCQGQEATHVGGTDARQVVRGTPGADVIVTRGASVWAGDGDDLICVVVGGGESFDRSMNGGGGDDEVHAEDSTGGSYIWLGDGDDRFTGSASFQEVHVDIDDGRMQGEDGFDPDGLGDDGDRDVVRGADWIFVRKPGVFVDDLGLGADGGRVSLAAGSFGGALLRTGGPSVLSLHLPERAYRIDDVANELTFAEESLRWGAGYTALGVQGGRGLTYRGTTGDDRIALPALASANMGAGDDELYVNGLFGAPGTLNGGPGQDQLGTSRESFDQNTVLDVARSSLSVAGTRRTLVGWDRYELYSTGKLTMLGSAGPDVLAGGACQFVVRAGDGSDRIEVGDAALDDATCVVPRRRSQIFGGSAGDTIRGNFRGETIHGDAGADDIGAAEGDDTVYGDDGNDSLFGGPGRDVVDGGANLDTCRTAEVRRRCER